MRPQTPKKSGRKSRGVTVRLTFSDLLYARALAKAARLGLDLNPVLLAIIAADLANEPVPPPTNPLDETGQTS